MTDDFDMLDFDEPTVEFDFEVEVEVDTDAIDQNRNYEMKRSLHAWLCFHGGLFSEWGITCESVDEAARSSAQRMQDEGHYRWDSAYAARERAMMSLPTQLGSEVTPSPISFDVEGIRMGYNLPMSIEIEDTVLARFNERFPGKAGCGFATWSSFTSYYRNLASYLVYDLDRILVFLEDLLPDYMREVDPDWHDRMENRHYRHPSVQVVGVSSERDRTVGQAVRAKELGRLVRVHAQITMLSESKTQFLTAAFKCARCEDGDIAHVEQYPFSDEMLFPIPCTVPGHSEWNILEPPESRVITIRRAHIQDPMVQSADTPSMMVEFQEELEDLVSPGEEVVLVGYVRSRPMGKQARRDRNRDVFMVVTGIESNSVQADVTVSEAERDEVISWTDGRPFSDRIEALTRSFAPHIKGCDDVKQVLMLQQSGGSHHSSRYDIHVALFGDPGTGKTEMALWSHSMSPGSRMASGERASIAGLVGGQSTKESFFSGSEKRVIEPGVLASVSPGGVAFIDEAHALDSKGSNLTERLNTALEFQEVPMSIIGGGKVTTKCPVIFVANPKKGDNTKFDRNSHLTYSQQAGMPASTMSRLDCPVVLLDELSDAQKEEERAMAALQNMSGHYRENADEEGILTLRFQQCYYAMAREYTHITVPNDVLRHLAVNQVRARLSAVDDDVVNARRVNTLHRLTCAAAKLDFCDTASMEHADFALAVMSRTLMDQAPSAAEGGKTSQQVKNTDGLWETLCQMHESQAKDQYTTSDIETYFASTKPVKRDALVTALTGFVATQKRHERWGAFTRPRKGHYQFEN